MDNKLIEIFFPNYVKRCKMIIGSKKNFAYYTTAETGLSILKNKEIWMRNVTCMNDYQEISYGIDLVEQLFKSAKYSEFANALGEKDICERVKKRVLNESKDWKYNTYITCISEHEESEDNFGRLSMWRAYGGNTGIAVILKNNIFLSNYNSFDIYTSPVEYLNNKKFHEKFDEIIMNIHREKEFLENVLNSCDNNLLEDFILDLIRSAILSIKHPGFSEEKEWRIIYKKNSTNLKKLKYSTCSINGIPQLVYKIPLTYKKVSDTFGISINEVLEKIIIGPTQHAEVIAEALKIELKNANVDNIEEKIICSDIPYRGNNLY